INTKGLSKLRESTSQRARFSQLSVTLSSGDVESFHKTFIEMHPYDQSVFFMKQNKSVRMQIYEYLSAAEIAEMIHYIVLEDAVRYFIEMDPRHAAMVLEQ